MSGGIQGHQNFPPIADEDLARLDVDPQLIPFIVSTAQRAEQSSSGEPQLTPEEAKNLAEILDKVVSSSVVNPGMKNRCFKILRKVASTHAILPKSYYVGEVVMSDGIPYASGGFADIWKGVLAGRPVCVKKFRTQTATNLDKIKRRFFRDIIGWRYVAHVNVVPFIGVSETTSPFCIVYPWMPNGNILEYIRKNRRVNRLQLLTNAACGLEYLHSLSIVHSAINPGNILIDSDSVARLGDFGVTGIITDPSVVEPGSTTSSKPGGVRYMAPELLNPTQFNLHGSNPTKESDIYSLAVTSYEVLTDIMPYGNARDGIIIFSVVTGDRPPRPQNARWLQDPIWNMIVKCWSERREQRLDVRSVHNQLSVSTIQATAEAGQPLPLSGVRSASPEPTAAEDPLLPAPHRDVPRGPVSIFVEERDLPNVPNPNQPGRRGSLPQRRPSAKLQKSGSTSARSQTSPPSRSSTMSSWLRGTPPKQHTFPLQAGEMEDAQRRARLSMPRVRKVGFSMPGKQRIRVAFKVVLVVLRLRKSSKAPGRPSG